MSKLCSFTKYCPVFLYMSLIYLQDKNVDEIIDCKGLFLLQWV